ncbi:hypothetical protein MPTK1_4g17440 [Marchantia polymorpha subsp. ruderalis]|uniref:Uncharacterized protein n=2 Tax=Marchantia polymorpha TaxID=3197 RepID=A0AAF6BAV2_MARPO|nr:hypothetical protein MARPO_0041s0026 [Marchantia polymorpha]BBN09136.1 hypothetical protein Mp_4g17440 [Marchantia polymorpha subsp. ruderalis]|eukprot:PTQ40124.1 hypothetical protein MARPO_0041s0026 [Marchantia polymorpha]
MIRTEGNPLVVGEGRSFNIRDRGWPCVRSSSVLNVRDDGVLAGLKHSPLLSVDSGKWMRYGAHHCFGDHKGNEKQLENLPK